MSGQRSSLQRPQDEVFYGSTPTRLHQAVSFTAPLKVRREMQEESTASFGY
jgi:hypothetical protein